MTNSNKIKLMKMLIRVHKDEWSLLKYTCVKLIAFVPNFSSEIIEGYGVNFVISFLLIEVAFSVKLPSTLSEPQEYVHKCLQVSF